MVNGKKIVTNNEVHVYMIYVNTMPSKKLHFFFVIRLRTFFLCKYKKQPSEDCTRNMDFLINSYLIENDSFFDTFTEKNSGFHPVNT